MNEAALFIELVKNIGFPAVIFAIWYIYQGMSSALQHRRLRVAVSGFNSRFAHKSQVKTFEEIIRNNFAVLKDLLETNRQHTGILSRLENKIDANLWCPFIREKSTRTDRRSKSD